MVLKLTILVLLWIIYFTIHSLLASNRVKFRLFKTYPGIKPVYRLLYNLVAIISLIPILIIHVSTISPRLIPPSDFLTYSGLILATGGVLVIQRSFRYYKLAGFLGISQLRKPDTPETDGLQTHGILKYVRHPLYTGTLMILIGYWFFSPTLLNLVTSISIIIYLAIGIRLEEKKLLEEYGNDYLEYQKKVPMLIPSFHIFRK